MHASEVPLVRRPVLPAVRLATTRRRPQYPFPIGEVRRKAGDMAATAQAVIATTACAYLNDRSS